jgi:hypothetical protein
MSEKSFSVMSSEFIMKPNALSSSVIAASGDAPTLATMATAIMPMPTTITPYPPSKPASITMGYPSTTTELVSQLFELTGEETSLVDGLIALRNLILNFPNYESAKAFDNAASKMLSAFNKASPHGVLVLRNKFTSYLDRTLNRIV